MFLQRDKPYYLGFSVGFQGHIPFNSILSYCLVFERDKEIMERIILIDNIMTERKKEDSIEETKNKSKPTPKTTPKYRRR